MRLPAHRPNAPSLNSVHIRRDDKATAIVYRAQSDQSPEHPGAIHQIEDAAAAAVDFVVTMSRESESTVTVDYATSNGTATAGEGYSEASGTLTFTAGET